MMLCVSQFAADKRIQVNFCSIPENAEEGVRQTLADFASNILDADNATLTCCSDGIDQSHHQCRKWEMLHADVIVLASKY